MTELAVDIVIPTHNRAHLIDTAVRAALDQSWWNTRVTVVDDGGSVGGAIAGAAYNGQPSQQRGR